MNKKRFPLFSLCLMLGLMSACGSDQSQTKKPSEEWNEEGYKEVASVHMQPVVSSEDSFLHASQLNSLGFRTSWSSQLQGGKKIRNMYLIKNSVLIETHDNEIHSLDRNSGNYKWIIQLDYPLDYPPSIMKAASSSEKIVYLVSHNKLYAIDATVAEYGNREYGKLRWKYILDHSPSAGAAGNEFFTMVPSDERNFVSVYHVKEIDPISNEPIIKYPRNVAWKRPLNGFISASPVYNEEKNNPIVIFGTNAGTLYGLKCDYSTDIAWTFPSSRQAGAFRAQVLTHGQQVYCPSMDHTLYVLNKNSGKEEGKITLDSSLSQTPWVSGSMEVDITTEGPRIIRNDLDIFVQSDANSFGSAQGTFYNLYVSDVVTRRTIRSEQTKEEKHIPRWEIDIKWQLTGQYKFLFRTKSSVYLLKLDSEEKIIQEIDLNKGSVVRTISLGDENLNLYEDPSSDYHNNRLFVTTDRDVFSIELKN